MGINLVADKTIEPIEDDQRFVVDGWAAGKFDLDVPKFLVAAAATVEMLGGPKSSFPEDKLKVPSLVCGMVVVMYDSDDGEQLLLLGIEKIVDNQRSSFHFDPRFCIIRGKLCTIAISTIAFA